MTACPKCGYANMGNADFCANPMCRTYLAAARQQAGWPAAPQAYPPQPPPAPGPPAGSGSPPGYGPAVQMAPAPAQQKRGVKITVEPSELSVEPGGAVTATVAVRNLGTRVEEFRLYPYGPGGTFASITPPALSVYPDAEQQAVVSFSPVRGPQSPAGPAPIELVARSVIHTDVVDVARGTVTIAPFQQLTATLVPDKRRGRKPGRHRVSVTNAGNASSNVQVAYRDQDGELTFEPSGGSGMLQPAAVSDFPVLIGGPQRFFGRTQRHPFTATVTGGGTQPPILLNGVRNQRALLPWWIPVAAVIIVALTLAVIPLLPKDKVPGVRNLAVTEAQSTLQKAGYKNIKPEYKSDPTVPKDTAIGTAPDQNQQVSTGDLITLFISAGPCTGVCKVDVPATKGRTQADAETALTQRGFKLGTPTMTPNELPKGQVSSSSPAEGTQADQGATVVLFISTGPTVTLTGEQLASFKGQTAAEVTKTLQAVPNVKTKNVEVHSNDVPSGSVLSAEQAVGKPDEITLKVARNTAVDLATVANKATWESAAGRLKFPGKVTDSRGAALIRDSVALPGGSTGRVLETVPRRTPDGTISGTFKLPEKIIAGDRLKANVGLLSGTTGAVTFTVLVDGVPVHGLGVDMNNTSLIDIDQDLAEVVGGSTVEIRVSTDAPSGDLPLEAVWQSLRIEGAPKAR